MSGQALQGTTTAFDEERPTIHVGGPELIKALLAPLPQLQIVPVGGADLNTAAAFIRNGAVALGVGSSLISQTASCFVHIIGEISQKAVDNAWRHV